MELVYKDKERTKVQGIRFCKDGYSFKGTQICRECSFGKLDARLGTEYNRVSPRAESMQGGQPSCHQVEQTQPTAEHTQDPWSGISSIGLFAPSNAQTYEPFPEEESAKKKKKETQKGLQPLMQVTNLKLESNMKEELLEAIYGTVERLEQKVDELSVSTKNAGAETVPASNDITKLDKSINAMFIKEEEVRGKISKLRDAIVVFADLIKVELGKNEQRSKFLVDAVKQMRQENDVSSKALQDKLKVMNKSPQKKVVTHRFEPTSKSVLLFIGGMALSLVLSIWGNLTQWREHQDWEEADLKYRALKMVLPSDDPNVRYIEKNFSVCPNKEVIENVRAHVNTYEDSIRYHIEMIQMAAIKDSIANSLFKEANEIKKKINKR